MTLRCLLKPLALTALLLTASARVFAVSLGDELILSALGDPVEVEIEVLQWEDMDLDRVQISAAGRDEYEVFDLTWLPVLENLNFNLVGPDLNGKVRVLISSRDPLNEPFLELLLVLRWPGGSLRREYVLLFDPPAPLNALSSIEEPPAVPVVENVPQLPQPVEALAPAVQEPLVEAAPPAPTIVVPEEAPRAEAPVVVPPVAEAPLVVVVPEPAVVEPEPAVIEPEPAAVEPAPAPEPPVQVVTVVVEEPAAATAAPEPVPEPVAPEPAAPAAVAEDNAVPEARTTLAIEVETVAPQPAQAPLDTNRRTYQVRAGDSLWNIARQFRPAGAGDNLYQVLLSIHNLNRNSFINGNISLLKANAVLQVPTVDDIERIDALSAEAEFERRWDQGTARFEATQRGEPIPLFAEEPPPEAVVVEEELPPGTEAPAANDDEGALIMVSQTNVPQPLQLAPEVAPAAAPVADTSAAPIASTAPAIVTQTQTITVDAPADEPVVIESPTTEPVPSEPRIATRAVVTAELEAEVAAMRTRRQTAEAVAQQLQASLEQARAARAAEASLFGTENLLLASSAAVLFALLLAGIVMSLRIAGDLRLMRSSLAGSAADLQMVGSWPASTTPMERKEPRMPEVPIAAAPEPRTPAQAPAKKDISDADDLFARMDDMIGPDSGNSSRNS